MHEDERKVTLDEVLPLLEELDALRALVKTVEKDFDWNDRSDEWTERVKAAYPTRNGSHEAYGTAMRMIQNRHSKSSLVALVNWLLVELEEAGR